MAAHDRGQTLGVVTEGSFSAGLTVRLDGDGAEDLQVGSFVVLESATNRYFSLINDLQLKMTDPGVSSDPPADSPFIQRALRGIHTFSVATVRPSLMLEDAAKVSGSPPRAVRTIPTHFTTMREAREEDFDVVFGAEGGEKFAIGSPIAMDDAKVVIDLKKLVARPSGIFGQTGTGKSVLTRLLLAGIIRAEVASALVFDMHDEYADEQFDRPGIPGLRDLFGTTEIKVYSLDAGNAAATNAMTIAIGMNQIEPADIELLTDELNLNETFSATAYLLQKQFDERWLSRLLEMGPDELQAFVAATGAHLGAVEAMRRKLQYLEAREYIRPHASADAVKEIVLHLTQGRHVVVQFGRFADLRDYMLVTNVLSRRIHAVYREAAMKRQQQRTTTEVRPLVVVLEEAHKFLSDTAARQSIFGTIAREMRKFGVSLLVVDQRPSQIDDEVMSQLATRVSGLLSDEHDIAAVLSGTGDRSALRSMLSALEPTQQCLVLGHAIPMPMVVRTRTYDRSLKNTRTNGQDELVATAMGVFMTPRKER